MKYISLLIAIAFCATACNDWLDVRPDTEQKAEDQFSSVDGFYGALTGCYMSMADQDAYGERLTMSDVETLANLWYIMEDTDDIEAEDLTKHDYTTTDARNAIQAMYAQLYNVIAQASMIIKYADERQDVFTEESTRKVIQGEAYALRAYCQFDALRLFGQMPRNASRQVELPYSETTSIHEMPPYYSFDAYVEKLKYDIEQAETLLRDNDPVFTYTFEDLNGGGVSDEYLMYRQSRLNYYAVEALKARVHLYLGETEEAYLAAKAIIEAKDVDGQAILTMSGTEDLPMYPQLPSECLFYLSKYDLMDYVPGILMGRIKNVSVSDQLVLTEERLTQLFQGEKTTDHNRYASCWLKGANAPKDANQIGHPVILKYYYEENDNDETSSLITKSQIIPMLRLSEVYLIAMETSTDLTEVNNWYQRYMQAHGVNDMPDFTTLETAREWIINEYRREFFAEGQMFYTYKRTGATTMLWREEPVDEDDYILPLPTTEYNPNNLLNQ